MEQVIQCFPVSLQLQFACLVCEALNDLCRPVSRGEWPRSYINGWAESKLPAMLWAMSTSVTPWSVGFGG